MMLPTDMEIKFDPVILFFQRVLKNGLNCIKMMMFNFKAILEMHLKN